LINHRKKSSRVVAGKDEREKKRSEPAR